MSHADEDEHLDEDHGADVIDENRPLRIGDYVILKGITHDGFMSAEGILEDDVSLQKVPPRFDDCVFQIFPDQQYSASRELLAFKEKENLGADEEATVGGDDEEEGAEDDVQSPEARAKKYLKSLERAHESEKDMNKKQFEQYLGTQLKFGNKIQLLHRKSQKFLTVNSKVTAKHEAENLKVYLDKEGNENSWFIAAPKFGIDRDGNPMESNAKITLILQVRESENSQVHIADSTFAKSGPSSKDREVNCSINPTGWMMSLYSEYVQKGDNDLCAGEIVKLHDPENDNYLRLRELPDTHRVDSFLESNKVGVTKTNTNFLWMIERHKNPAAGGKLAYGADTYRLRHLNTGKYLCCKEASKLRKAGRKMVEAFKNAKGGPSPKSTVEFIFTSIDQGRKKECGLFFHSANEYVAEKTARVGAAPVFIQDNDGIQLQSWASDTQDAPRRYLHLADEKLSEEVASVPTWKTKAIVEQKNPKTGAVFNLCLRRFEVSDAQLTDIMVGVAGLPFLKRYLKKVTDHSSHAELYDDRVLKPFKKVLQQLILFLAHMPMVVNENGGIKYDEVDQRMRVLGSADMEFRQQLLQEQGVVTTVVKILEKLNDADTLAIAQQSFETTVGSPNKKSKRTKGLVEFDELKKDIACASLRMLYLAILENPESQMDLADHLGTLIGYVPIEEYATKIITHMLSSNAELQSSKVKDSDIKYFITMIRENPLTASYLELLRSVCSCGGNGIDANQGRVVDKWLDEAEDLSMKLQEVSLKGQKNEPMMMHVEPGPEIREEILGEEMLSSGVPSLSITWDTSIPHLTPEAISPTGNSLVPLEYLFGDSAKNVQQRQRIQDYFIAQMYLAAETCLDRNYCAMEKCADHFKYEWLVGIMKNPSMPGLLKAAATKVISTLWVDRGPQVLIRVPRLSYAMEEIELIPDNVELASCAQEDKHKFYLLTDIINSNIHKLKDSGWDQYTRQQMALLLQLVRFRFYNTPAQIRQITDPLIRALDCRDQDPSNMLMGDKTMELPTASPIVAEPLDVERGADGKIHPEVVATAIDAPKRGFPCFGMIIPACGYEEPIWNFLDTIGWLVVILLIVITGVTLGIMQMYGVFKEQNDSIQVFEYIASAIFFLDLFLKLYCYPIVVQKGFASFCCDILNLIDIIIVAADIVLISIQLSTQGGGNTQGGTFSKLGRMARLVRLTRLLKAARLVNKITEEFMDEEEPEWEKPARYWSTPKNQLDTMLQMIRILAKVGDLTRDFTLGRTLSELKSKHFLVGSEASEEVKEQDNMPPLVSLDKARDLFEGSQAKGQELALQAGGDVDSDWIDKVFLDICLYEHNELVQSALNVLMNHHSSQQFLLTDLQSTQLLSNADPKTTAEFRSLRENILELRNMAEEQELWGELESEEDIEQSDKMKRLLRDVTYACFERTEKVNFYTAYVPIKSRQDMIRNLGGFETAMTILGLYESIEDADEDADEEEIEQKQVVNENTLEILKLCNNFLAWFISGNAANQELAHEELETFMETIDENIDSGMVIAAIIRGNSELIRQIPKVLISETIERIVNADERNPEYLSILEAMVYLEDFDGANNVDVQSEICKNLTKQAHVDKTLYLCQDVDGEQYNDRIGLMRQAQQAVIEIDPIFDARSSRKGPPKDITLDEDTKHLDPELKYHCRLLDVLAGCAIGRMNVTTVETKLQSLYTPDQCLMALLDPQTSYDVLGPLAAFFFHAVVEVEIQVTGMMQNMLMWEFLERIPKELQAASSILSPIVEQGAQKPMNLTMALLDGPMGIKARQQLVYTWFCIRIYTKFFEDYYTPSLRSSELADDLRYSPSSIKYYATRAKNGAVEGAIDDEGETLKAAMSTDLDVENTLDMSSVDSAGDDGTLGLDSDDEEEEEEEEEGETHWIDELMEKLHHHTLRIFTKYKDSLETADQRVLDEGILALRAKLSTLGGVIPMIESAEEEKKDEFQEKLDNFVERLCDDEDLALSIGKDRTKIASVIQNLPSIVDDVEDDLRFEALVESLVSHIKSRLENDGTKKSLDPECTKTTIWLVQVFRRMIEDAWGMSIDERDDDGGEEQDIASEEIIAVLDKRGVTCLCLDLIAVGIDSNLILECVNLCVALLFKEGGAAMVQETMNKHLMASDSELFFRQIKNEIGSIKRFYEYEDIPPTAGAESLSIMLAKQEGEDDADPITPENIRVLRFLQLMSEGHFEANQDLMRVQGANKPINLLNEFVDLLNGLSKKKSRAATAAAAAVSDVILEVIQGPCKDNQDYFARSTELIEIMMRILRESPKGDCEQEEDDEVKKILLEIFEGLTEGQGKPSEVFDKILSVLDLDVLTILIMQGDPSGGDELTEIQVEGLVLLQMFMDYDPEIASQVRLSRSIKAKMNKEVISVEVVWNGKLQRRFFPTPSICAHIADATKDVLVETVNRDSPDAKLQDFIQKAQDIHREVQHQQSLSDTALGPWIINEYEIPGTAYLANLNLNQVFSRTNQENITWCSFVCALTINFIFLFTLEHKPGWVPGMGNTLNYESGGFYSTYSKAAEAHFDENGALLDSEGHRIKGDSAIYYGKYDDMWDAIITVLNIFNILFSFFTLVLFLVVRCPVKFRKLRETMKEDIKSETKRDIWAFLMTCTDTFTLYYLFYTIIAFISYRYESALHPFLLLDIIVKNSTTADVVKAVVYPAKQLSAAALLGVFVIYIFAMITFKNFASDFRYDGGDDVYGKPGFDDFMSQEDAEHLNEDCRTLWGCFKVSLNYGMRLSGGTGDIMQHTLEGRRLLLDLLYFLVVLVVLLNVIFGIIIDTFSELRQEKMDKLKDKIGFCFICGIPSSTFEQASSEPAPFKRHIKNDHYMWNYLNFIIFIWEQDKDDDDGLELYVRKLLEKEEITWFPVGSALCLSATDTKEESTAEHIDRVSSGLRVAVDDANEKQLKTIGEVNVSLNGTVQKIHEMLVKAENEKKPVKSEGQRADEGAAALIKDSKRNR